jgi:hypothetical protein
MMAKSSPTLFRRALEEAWRTGNFWNPKYPDCWNVRYEDLDTLKPDDNAAVYALISMSEMDSSRYTEHVLNQHSRLPHFDGVAGPAMEAMISDPRGRCPVPDYAPPPDVSFSFADPDLQLVVERMQLNAVMEATGTGNWKGCHGVGNFHSAICQIDDRGLPAHVRPLWIQILQNCQAAYAEYGMLWHFVNQEMVNVLTGEKMTGRVNTKLRFVASSAGWIGLAIVGQGETCSTEPIWLQLLSTFGRSDNPQTNLLNWWALLWHELGHNLGFGHTNGGLMNPSLQRPASLRVAVNDPIVQRLRAGYGGQPVPIPGGPKPPPPKPPAGDTVADQIRELQVKLQINDIVNANFAARIKALEAKTK